MQLYMVFPTLYYFKMCLFVTNSNKCSTPQFKNASFQKQILATPKTCKSNAGKSRALCKYSWVSILRGVRDRDPLWIIEIAVYYI